MTYSVTYEDRDHAAGLAGVRARRVSLPRAAADKITYSPEVDRKENEGEENLRIDERVRSIKRTSLRAGPSRQPALPWRAPSLWTGALVRWREREGERAHLMMLDAEVQLMRIV